MGEMQTPAVKLPAMTLNLELTPTGMTNEDISYEMVLTEANVADEPGVLPQVADAMKASFEKVKGTSMKGVVSTTGVSKQVDLNISSDAAPESRQALEQMKETFGNLITPFPLEPVGPGAKWENKSKVKTQGMTIDQTMTYELASVEGENMTIKVNFTQSAANQKFESPTMPGMKLNLTKMTGSGAGEKTMDLGHLIARAATLELHSDYAMAMDMGGQKQNMTMKLDVKVQLE